MALTHIEGQEIQHFAKVLKYPCGITDIMASSKPVFREPGFEAAEDWQGSAVPADPKPTPKQRKEEPNPEALARSMRRARAMVRRLALANDFSYFVTLTLSGDKVDRYNPDEVVRKLNQWCSNQVKRHGLKYILVPERHKDGAIHFHGFFSEALETVDSGTVKIPGVKKPKRPRSKAERERWLSAGGQVVYNLPAWTLGFTTAIKVHGEYPAAVAYVCKYIGKEDEKPAGRWYYSGGALAKPEVTYADLSADDLAEEYGKKAFRCSIPGQSLCIVNGIRDNPTAAQREQEEIESLLSDLLDRKE